jgi:dihydroorotate dehydrogenase electron transfer subunit
MIRTDAPITDIEESGPFIRLVLSAPEIIPNLAPGRFALADLGEATRTPLFPAGLEVGPEASLFEVLVLPNHPAAALRLESTMNLIGPLGRGFEVPPTARHLLLVADTAHLPALLSLTRPRDWVPSGEPGLSIALLLSAVTVTRLYPVQLLPPALEVHVATADGSAGHHGSGLELFPDLARWADCICVADDPATYPALAKVVRDVRIGPPPRLAQALVVPPMACGVGACQGCAVETAHGFKLACTDGPVFDLMELR